MPNPAVHASRNAVLDAPRPSPEAEEIYRRWVQFLDDEFTRHHSAESRSEIVRDQLHQIYLGRPHGGKMDAALTSELPGNVMSLSLDPMNITLEAEHFPDVDRARFTRLKPLIWFWKMFDRSTVALNYWLGLRLRAMLGRHIFEHLGSGVRICHGVDITYGYNLSIDDGAIIRQRALLNDRGGIRIGRNAAVGSYVRIFSHIQEPAADRVRLQPTIIGAGARIGSHEIILAGQHVPEGAIVGSFPGDSL